MIFRGKKQILAMLSTEGKEYIDQVIIAQLISMTGKTRSSSRVLVRDIPPAKTTTSEKAKNVTEN